MVGNPLPQGPVGRVLAKSLAVLCLQLIYNKIDENLTHLKDIGGGEWGQNEGLTLKINFREGLFSRI